MAAAAALYSVAAVTTTHVDMRNNAFQPATVEVAVNDTVTWTNRDQVVHTVRFDNNDKQPSGPVPPGATHSTSFSTPGAYRYTCEIHQAMTGTVTVRPASATSSTTTTRPRATSTTTTTAEPLGSSITAPPDSTSSTTTSPGDDTTTTTSTVSTNEDTAARAADPAGPDDDNDNVDVPGAVAALLLLLTAGGALVQTRGGRP